jgi:hypothetical protein
MKIMIITVGAQPRTPCRSLFKKLEILPIPRQYIINELYFKQSRSFSNKFIYTQYYIITKAQQPYMGSGLLFPRLLGLANWPRCCSIDPDVTARAIWQAVIYLGEK